MGGGVGEEAFSICLCHLAGQVLYGQNYTYSRQNFLFVNSIS